MKRALLFLGFISTFPSVAIASGFSVDCKVIYMEVLSETHKVGKAHKVPTHIEAGDTEAVVSANGSSLTFQNVDMGTQKSSYLLSPGIMMGETISPYYSQVVRVDRKSGEMTIKMVTNYSTVFGEAICTPSQPAKF